MAKIKSDCLPLNDPMRKKIGCDSCTLLIREDDSSYPDLMCERGFNYWHPHLQWPGKIVRI